MYAMDYKYEGVWGIVRSAAGEVIGRFPKFNKKEGVINAWKAGAPVEMGPVWEFQTGIIQEPDSSMTLVTQAIPYGACVKECKISILPASILFFSDMDSRDVRKCTEAIELAVEFQQQASAAESGITLTNKMPSQSNGSLQ